MYTFLCNVNIIGGSARLFQELANLVSESDLKVGRLYPPLDDIKAVSMKIATKIVEDAYKNGKLFDSVLILVVHTARND